MKAYVALGANLGNSKRTIEKAIRHLEGTPFISIQKVSALYRTQAVGGPKQPDFLNGVIEIQTTLSPFQLLASLLKVERALGRIRRERWGPRVIDLDLLAYGRKIIRRRSLAVPHPRYHERRFVLVPFCDLAPRFIHPSLKLQNRVLLRKLTPQGQRVTIAAQWNGTRLTPSKPRRKTKSRS